MIPTVLSVAGRTTQAENKNVYLSFTFGPNLNRYLSDVFMISLNCQSVAATGRQ